MKKVTKIKQKLHSKQFSKSYCRVERENTALSPDNITDEASPFLIPSQGSLLQKHPSALGIIAAFAFFAII